MTTIFDIETWKEITDAGHGGQHNSMDIVASWRRDRDELLIEIAELRGALEEIRDKGIDFDCPSCGEEFSWFPSERLYKALGKA